MGITPILIQRVAFSAQFRGRPSPEPWYDARALGKSAPMPIRTEFIPPNGAYRHTITVQPADIDDLGHANNVVWVRWVNEAAIAHSRSVGLDRQMYFMLRVIWVVRRHEVEYLAPAIAGETLEAVTWVADLRGATSRRRTVIERDGRTLLRAETTWALIDTDTSKPRRIPKEMLERYGFSTDGA